MIRTISIVRLELPFRKQKRAASELPVSRKNLLQRRYVCIDKFRNRFSAVPHSFSLGHYWKSVYCSRVLDLPCIGTANNLPTQVSDTRAMNTGILYATRWLTMSNSNFITANWKQSYFLLRLSQQVYILDLQ